MKQIQEIVNNSAAITHLTGASNYTWVHFLSEPQVLLSKPLTYFESQLPSYIRIHKTSLINPAYIQSIQPPKRAKSPGTIVLKSGERLPISRRRWLDLADLLTGAQQKEKPEDVLARKAPESENGQLEEELLQSEQAIPRSKQWLFAFCQDEKRRSKISRGIHEKWPHYAIRFFDNGTSLIEKMIGTAANDLPTLVLLDVHKIGWAAMNTLESIKSNKLFCRIPTVIFIRELAGSDVEACYAAGANSVVRQNSDETFDDVVDRIYRYWLNFAALPANLRSNGTGTLIK